MSSLTPGFMIVHGNQPELLRQLLVNWYRTHPLQPLEDETILVHSNGMAQWLKFALAATAEGEDAGGCGIAAAFDMLLPARLIWRAYRAVLGHATVPERSPFDQPALLWRLMRMLPEQLAHPDFAPLARFLGDDTDLRKRFQLAEKIADLFDQYQVYRADWLNAWGNGEDVLIDAQGRTRPLDPAHRWQARLWRALLPDTGETLPSSRAMLHQRFMTALAARTQCPPGLPRRITVFGLSALPAQALEALRALSRFVQVILCVHNPCEHYWADLLSTQEVARRHATRHARKQGMPEQLSEEDLHAHAHPLLASWGRQGRDYIALLEQEDQPATYRCLFEQVGLRIDLFQEHGQDTLLNQLQNDILQLRTLSDTRQRWPAVDLQRDHSLRFHIAHSAQREVEILHDQLLAAFEADPHLNPRDVIVMVPDIDAYAPHIEAVFSRYTSDDARAIAFSIADQSVRQHTPLAKALDFLLHLPDMRLSASEVFDLLETPALRARFAFNEEHLPLLRRWIEHTHIRWGLHAAHRRQLIEREDAQNTWFEGVRQMLFGYARGLPVHAGQDPAWHGIEPYPEVAGLDAVLLGPLERLLRQLDALLTSLSIPATPETWGTRLRALLLDFFQAESIEDQSVLLRLQDSLQEWIEHCTAAHLDTPLPLAVVREHWLAQLDAPRLSQRFMAGRLTFATLMPMRAIPFRMVCLLGMNDGEFPRNHTHLDFDLMAGDLRPGDRSRREDDRYLFLEALLSARQRVHISWIGRSIQDNSERPPSVLVAQLRDHLAAGWTCAGTTSGDTLLDGLTHIHRLHAFHPDYFPSDHNDGRWFTYAHEWEVRAQAVLQTSAPLPPLPGDATLSLSRLTAFLKDPPRAFFQDRLGIYVSEAGNEIPDHEPFTLDGLAQWQLREQLIQAELDAYTHLSDIAHARHLQLERIRRRGALPHGALADLAGEALIQPLDRQFEAYQNLRTRWPYVQEDLDFFEQLPVPDGLCKIEGRLRQLYSDGQQYGRIVLSASALLASGKKYRRELLLDAWVVHLASHLRLGPLQTTLIGTNGFITLMPLDVADARTHFDALCAAYRHGLCAPLPLAPRTGFAWLEHGGKVCKGALSSAPEKAMQAARSRYEGSAASPGEVRHSPYLQRAYADFGALWSDGQFSELCATLYAPIARQIELASPSSAPSSTSD